MSTEHEQKWNEFLEKWPLSRIKEMSIEEYTKAGSKESFTYWLESELDQLGSIWGGSAFKFGIFNRNDQSSREDDSMRKYTDEYGWHPKYGDTPESAFSKVRDLIVETIEAAQSGDLKKIDSIDLGDAYKWKVAFLYQSSESPIIVPIYKKEMLKKIAEVNKNLPVSDLQKLIMDKKPSDLGVLAYGKQQWEAYDETVSSEGTSYWLYAPGTDAQYWDDFHSKGIMAIGWDDLGDLTTYTDKNEVVKRLQELENTTSSKKNDATATYQFCNEIKPGDVIIAKKGRSEYVGYGVVTGEYEFNAERDYFRHVRTVKWSKKGSWFNDEKGAIKTLTNVTQYKDFVKKILSLMDIVHSEDDIPNEVKATQATISSNKILYGPPGTGKTYELLNEWIPKYRSVKRTAKEKHEDALREFVSNATWWEVVVYVMVDIGGNSIQVKEINEHPVLQMKASLSSNKNVKATVWGNLQMHTWSDSKTVNYTQRQSPALFDKNPDSSWHLLDQWQDIVPDTAETINAIRGNESSPDELIKRYEFVTFHQSYGYEEFIEGLRPRTTDDGQISYDVRPGVFQRICNRAKLDPDNQYAIFIDEINRGNMSKIFGELITLIETDKRVKYNHEGKPVQGDKGLEITLPYSGNNFGVPSNLDIIGTMNTADRSIALLDIALRRRFEFKELMPDPDAIKGTDGKGTIEDGAINLRDLLRMLNKRIRLLAGRELQLGHAFFCGVKNLDELHSCFANKIIPLLQEYFYGHWERIQLVLGDQPEQLSVEQKNNQNECCFILSETLDEVAVLGFDHDDHDSRQDFYVNPNLLDGTLSEDAYKKIYQVKNATEANS